MGIKVSSNFIKTGGLLDTKYTITMLPAIQIELVSLVIYYSGYYKGKWRPAGHSDLTASKIK